MGKTQADFRRDINPRDQFGRKWQMCIEIATGDPTGGIFPAGWTDPLRTPMKHVSVPRNEDGQAEIGKVKIDYATWAREHDEETEKWYTQLYENAIAKYSAIDPARVATLDRDPFLMRLTGPKPWPAPAVIRQAANGDRQYLGFEPLDAEHRRELNQSTIEDLKAGLTVPQGDRPTTDPNTPPNTYQEFIGWAGRVGAAPAGDLKKIAELWADHRKNLQAA